MHERVIEAIQSLPEHERVATSLFYINGYSQNEIASFLEVPVSTVKSRLYSARKRLKERMMDMVADTFGKHPLPDDFTQNTIEKALKEASDLSHQRRWVESEDMLRDVINDVSRKLFQEVDFNQERLVQEISSTYGKDAADPSSVNLKQSPELGKIIEWMLNSWQSKLPYRYCRQREKDIFDRKDGVADSIKKEYVDSALAFVTASAAVKGIVKDEMLSDKVFVPKRISFNM